MVNPIYADPGILFQFHPYGNRSLAHVRASWSVARHPGDVKRIAALEKGMEHLERAAKLALEYSLQVADRGIVDKAKASAQRAAEAIAEANRPLLN